MRERSNKVASMLGALCLGLLATVGSAGCQASSPADLPLVNIAPASPARGPVVLMLSGDGDWLTFMSTLGKQAAALGSPVVGLKSRVYLHKPHTPDEVADDMAGAVRQALATYGRSDVLVIGYSRGAEMAPFMINRWPADLRAKVKGVALIGAGEWANFTFHKIDLVKFEHRPDDLPLRPEIARLGGIPIVCVYGVDEGPGLCANPVPGMRVESHPGGHRVAKDDEDVARMILADLGLGAS
jgi:type IV secretory pathway VirJ component